MSKLPIFLTSRGWKWLLPSIAATTAVLSLGFSYSPDPMGLLILRASQLVVLFASAWVFQSILLQPDDDRKGTGWRVFLSIALLLLFWLPMGYDVTDAGTRAAKSYFLFDDLWPRFVGMKIGSTLINSLWLHLFPTPSLIWSRIGYLLIEAGIGATTYVLLKDHFSKKVAAIAAILSLFLCVTYVYKAIHYSNLPVLLTMLGIGFLLSPSLRVKGHHALAGAMMAAGLFTKFPLILLLPIAALYFVVLWYASSDRKQAARQAVHFFLGYAAGLILLYGWLAILGGLESYLQTLQKNFVSPYLLDGSAKGLKRHAHDPDSLTTIYQRNFWILLRYVGASLALGVVAYLGVLSKRYWLSVTLTLVVILTGIWLTDAPFWSYSYFGAAVMVHGILYLRGRLTFDPSWSYWVLALMFVSFAGSNVGIRNIIMSGGASLYFAWLLAGLFKEQPLEDLKAEVGFKGMAMVLALSIIGVVFYLKNDFVYRDGPASKLTAPLHGPAEGVFTTPSRAAVVNPLIDQLASLGSDKELFCANLHAMHNFIANVEPDSVYYWRLPGRTKEWKDSYFSSERAPDHILLATVDTRDPAWPNTEDPCIERDIEYYRYYEGMLRDPNGPYRLQWSNGAFELYERKK